MVSSQFLPVANFSIFIRQFMHQTEKITDCQTLLIGSSEQRTVIHIKRNSAAIRKWIMESLSRSAMLWISLRCWHRDWLSLGVWIWWDSMKLICLGRTKAEDQPLCQPKENIAIVYKFPFQASVSWLYLISGKSLHAMTNLIWRDPIQYTWQHKTMSLLRIKSHHVIMYVWWV